MKLMPGCAGCAEYFEGLQKNVDAFLYNGRIIKFLKTRTHIDGGAQILVFYGI